MPVCVCVGGGMYLKPPMVQFQAFKSPGIWAPSPPCPRIKQFQFCRERRIRVHLIWTVLS